MQVIEQATSGAPESDEKARQRWYEFMGRRVPVVIYPLGPSHPVCPNKYAVAPEEAVDWFLGTFGSVSGAKVFASNNDLDFTEHANKPHIGHIPLATVNTGRGTAWSQPAGLLPLANILVTDVTGTQPPQGLETAKVLVALCKPFTEDPIFSATIDGRAGLNDWYAQNVGYKPDEDEFIVNPRHLLCRVVEMMYRHHTGDAN